VTEGRLLERGAALDRLGAAVADAAAGAGRVVVVAGEAGIGKTTLVRRYAERAGPGLRVVWGACDDLTVPEPLGPIHDLAGQLGPRLETALDDRRGIGRALRQELAEEVPTLCVVEDCHWADEATLDAIAFVARRAGGGGFVLLLTFRDDEVDAGHRLRAVVGSIPPEDLVRIQLEPLSRAAVEELADASADELSRPRAGTRSS
jgi:predicted ATPase